MRTLLALILMVPVLAQEPAAKPEGQAKPESQAKPEGQAKPEAQAKPEEKTAAPAAEQTAASPVPTVEDWLAGSIDFGYRFLPTPGGSQTVYRSVVNLGEGPKLLGADFTLQDPKHRLFDRIDVRANSWGGDPYNTAHVDARKQGVYDFRFDYRNIAYFNALPSFANPNLVNGIYLSEHQSDTHRRMSSFDLDLMPGRRIIPYFVYSRDAGRGRGVTTFVSDGNEYAVPDILSDHTDNYRGGLRFEFNRWHITVEQGATHYSDDQQVYENQFNPGNRTTPLGTQTLSLSKLNQLYGITADGMYSKALLTASPVSWANIYGQFLFSQPKTDVHYADSLTGNLAVVSSLLFYTGQQDVATGTAKAPHTSGSIGFELRPLKRLRVMESLSTDRTHNAAFDILTQTLLFGSGGTQAVPPAALNDRLVLVYNRQQVDVFYDLLSKLTLRGGYRYVWGNATVRAGQLSQIGALESGEVRQQVGLAGATFRTTQKLSFNVDYEGASSSSAYFRTSLYDYHRARLRARYQALGSLTLQATASVFSNQNPAPDVNLDSLSRFTSLTAFWTPGGGKRLSVTADYTRSTLRSDLYFRIPTQLNQFSPSFYRDNGHTATTLVDLSLPGYGGLTPKLSAGGSLFISSGSRPTEYFQPLFRLSLPLHKNVYWNTEWRWYGYEEAFYTFEGFRAHAIVTGLRLVR